MKLQQKALVAAMLTVAAALSGAPAMGSPEDNQTNLPPGFESCGSDEPPSGPYLDLQTMIVWTYNCSTHVLTPGAAATHRCDAVVVDGDAYPLQGFCAIVHSQSDTSVKKWIFAAVKGNYDLAFSYIDGHGGYGDDCHRGTPPLFGYQVTFLDWQQTCDLEPCSPQQRFKAHADLSGDSPTVDAFHDGYGVAC